MLVELGNGGEIVSKDRRDSFWSESDHERVRNETPTTL